MTAGLLCKHCGATWSVVRYMIPRVGCWTATECDRIFGDGGMCVRNRVRMPERDVTLRRFCTDFSRGVAQFREAMKHFVQSQYYEGLREARFWKGFFLVLCSWLFLHNNKTRKYSLFRTYASALRAMFRRKYADLESSDRQRRETDKAGVARKWLQDKFCVCWGQWVCAYVW